MGNIKNIRDLLYRENLVSGELMWELILFNYKSTQNVRSGLLAYTIHQNTILTAKKCRVKLAFSNQAYDAVRNNSTIVELLKTYTNI